MSSFKTLAINRTVFIIFMQIIKSSVRCLKRMIDKSRIVTLKLDLLQGKTQNKKMLDLYLSFISNDGMMIECEAKLYTKSIFVLTCEKMQNTNYTQKKKFSQYLSFLIKSTILHISLSNFLHELYYRSFTFTCSLRDK